MLEWLKNTSDQARKLIGDEVSRFKNREFMQAVVAGAVALGYVDNEFSLAEKEKLRKTLEFSNELRVFDKSEVAKFMADFVGKFDFDRDFALAETFKVIGRLKSNEEAARLLIRILCILGAADGNFDENERKLVVRFCNELGLKAAEFDLA